MHRTALNVPVAGGEIVGWVQGSGLPVLLLHGGPVGYEYLDGLAAEFLPGFAVAAYQQRGLSPSTLSGPFDMETEAGGEWDDVIDGQVARSVGGTAVARAPVATLTSPGTEDAGAESLPGPRAVQSVVPAAVGLAAVLGAAATRAAGDDTTDRAQFHASRPMRAVSDLTLVTLVCTPVDIAISVIGAGGSVYTPQVLRRWCQGHVRLHERLTMRSKDRRVRTSVTAG